jgi:Nidogen-like
MTFAALLSARRDRVWASGHTDDTKFNTFQAVVAWDATRTYTLFFYPSDGLTWDLGGSATAPAAVVRRSRVV